MTARKPLFMSGEGYSEEMALTDSITLGGLTMGGGINMSPDGGTTKYKITNTSPGTTAGDVLVYGQNGAHLGDNNQFGTTTYTGPVNMGNNEITNLNAPTNASDAVNKAYVDAVASGLSVHDHVQALDDANFAVGSGGLPLLDGYQILNNDRILLTGQTDAKQNGIWIAHSGAWARATDLTTGDHAQGVYTFVQNGDTYGGTGWTCTATAPTDVVGTDPLPWGQFSSTGHVSAGDGIAINTGTISVNLAVNSGLMFDVSTPGKLEAKPDTARGLDKDVNGLFVKVDGTSIGFGTGGNAGKLVALGAGSSESVENDIPLTSGGNIAIGDPVYINDDDTVAKGDCADDGKSRIIGLAKVAQGTPGNPVKVISTGIVTGCLTGAVSGAGYYLQSGGGIGPALPGGGKRVIQCGIAKNPTDLFVRIVDYGKKAA